MLLVQRLRVRRSAGLVDGFEPGSAVAVERGAAEIRFEQVINGRQPGLRECIDVRDPLRRRQLPGRCRDQRVVAHGERERPVPACRDSRVAHSSVV